MPDGSYNVLAFVPVESDFSLDNAFRYFQTLGQTSEVVPSPHGGNGFRVHIGDWSIVAWLEDDPGVLRESEDTAEDPDLPPHVPAQVLARCSRRLSIWSDEDHDFDHTNAWISSVDRLRRRFGLFVLDAVNGEWWEE